MSGGLEEMFDLQKMPADEKEYLWTILFQAYHKNSIMGCSIIPDPSVREAKLANGLVKGHAYTITKLVNFDSNGRETKLLRIRNPWGNDVEWKGAWSDNSRNWDRLSDETKQELGLVSDNDGEFWMEFKDFLAEWHNIQICHLSADSFSDNLSENANMENMSWRKLLSDDESSGWKCTMFHSGWSKGKTAGGSGVSNQAKFWTNPQFLINVEDVDAYDNENKATIIVALMQKHSRSKRIDSESAEEFIQFKLFRVKDQRSVESLNKSTGLKLYANQVERIGASGSYINSREVTKRFRVEPGYYLIVPSTYDDDREYEFLLRVFTEQAIETSSLDQQKDDLSEDEFFLEIEETDQIFNSWADLMGEGANVEDEESEDQSEQRPVSNNKKKPQEACNLM
jgi:calpain